MSEDPETRRQVIDNTVAIARFELRIKSLEEDREDRKTLLKNLKMAVIAAIIGAVFTAKTLIDMAQAAVRNMSD